MNRRVFTPGTIAMLAGLAAFFGLFLIYPVVWMLRGAFVVDGRFTLEFFAMAFRSPLVVGAVTNSLLLGTLVTVLTTLLSLPLAYLFTRYDFRGEPTVQLRVRDARASVSGDA